MNIRTSPGYYIGWTFLVIFALVLLVGLVLLTVGLVGRRKAIREQDEDDANVCACVGGGVGAAGLVLLLLMYWGMYPLTDLQYHQYRPQGGIVSEIASRALATSEHGSTDYYAVQFGSDDTYRCEDTRCALVQKGDVLFLSCIREWQFNGTDGYSCDFVSSKKNRANS